MTRAFKTFAISDVQKMFILNMLLAAVYFFTATLGLKLSAISGFATLVWAPSGISLAALLIYGKRLWPGVALGAFGVNFLIGGSPMLALGIAAGNSLEAVLGAQLLKRTGFSPSFGRLRDVALFLFLAAFLSTLTSPTIGVTCLYLGGRLLEGPVSTWAVWWFGDMGGELLVAPLLLVWSTASHAQKSVRRFAEFVGISLLVVLGSCVIFTDLLGTNESLKFPRTYLIFPILMIVANRMGQRGVVLATFTVSAIVIGITCSGQGRFWTGSLPESLFYAQIFLSVLAISKLVLAAALTERNVHEAALARSNAQREAILNSALDGIIAIDRNGIVLEFNPAAERIFRLKREDVMGREMVSVVIPERLREEYRKGMARYIATGYSSVLGHRIEMPALRSDGLEFPIELSVLPMKMEGPEMFTGFIEDISEKKEAARSRQRYEEGERFLAEATTMLSSSIDQRATLRNATAAAVPSVGDFCVVQIVGEDGAVQAMEHSCSINISAPLLEDGITRFLATPGGPRVLAEVIRTSKARLFSDVAKEMMSLDATDNEFRRISGDLKIQSIMISPLVFQGKAQGAVLISSSGRNFDQQDFYVFEEFARRVSIAFENSRLYKKAQEAIYARDEFLSVASHELRTPLTSLFLQLQMLRRTFQKNLAEIERLGGKAPDVVPVSINILKNLEGSETQCERVSALVDELLDLTRIQLGRFELSIETVDLVSATKEIAERFKNEADQKGIKIQIESPQSVMGQWDRVRIEQIVSNLISNSLKYGEGKPVLISIEEDRARGRAMLVVKDNGMGISESMQKKIFERFERAGVSGRKIAGLGLGLYITRQITEAHGGKIVVESDVGKGAKFTVELPTNRSDASNVILANKKVG